MVTIERSVGNRPLASTAHASAAPRRRTARRPSEGATTALSLGFTTAYLSVIVLLPIAALIWASRANGLHAFWSVVTDR